AAAAAGRLGRRGGHGAEAPPALAERLLHAQGTGRRSVPRRLDAAGTVRRPPARARRWGPRPRLRAAGALSGPWRVPAARSLAGALRARRPPGRAGAAEAEARRRGS